MNLHLAQQSGPTYISMETIGEIIDGVIESERYNCHELEDFDCDSLLPRGHGYPSEACATLWAQFEVDLHKVIADYFSAHSPYCGRDKAESDANEFMCADGPYAVFMSLNGEGVGVWDSWVCDHALVSDSDCRAMFTYIESKLGHYADITGGGSLNDAHRVCAYRDED